MEKVSDKFILFSNNIFFEEAAMNTVLTVQVNKKIACRKLQAPGISPAKTTSSTETESGCRTGIVLQYLNFTADSFEVVDSFPTRPIFADQVKNTSFCRKRLFSR